MRVAICLGNPQQIAARLVHMPGEYNFRMESGVPEVCVESGLPEESEDNHL